MSNSIIEDLYYVRRGNFEAIPISKEYNKILSEIIEKEKVLTKHFTKEQVALFDDYCDLNGLLSVENNLSTTLRVLKLACELALNACNNQQKKKANKHYIIYSLKNFSTAL